MADIDDTSWSEIDASNSNNPPNGWPEGMNPSDVNNSARADKGAVKRWYNRTIPKVTAGTSTAYTLAYGVAPGALNDGMKHLIRFHTTNGAAATLNVNGLGAKPLFAYIAGTWMAAPVGAFPTDMIVEVTYDNSSGNYRILGMHSCLGVQSFAGGPAIVDFTNVPATANNLEVRFQLTSATGAPDVGLQCYINSVLDTANYSWAVVSATVGSPVAGVDGSNSAGSIKLAAGVSGFTFGGYAKFEAIQYTASLPNKTIQYQTTYYNAANNFVSITGSGTCSNASASLTGIRIGLSGGTAAAGSTATLFATI